MYFDQNDIVTRVPGLTTEYRLNCHKSKKISKRDQLFQKLQSVKTLESVQTLQSGQTLQSDHTLQSVLTLHFVSLTTISSESIGTLGQISLGTPISVKT